MADSALDERSIFLQAVELSSADDRASFLDEACGEESAVAKRGGSPTPGP